MPSRTVMCGIFSSSRVRWASQASLSCASGCPLGPLPAPGPGADSSPAGRTTPARPATGHRRLRVPSTPGAGWPAAPAAGQGPNSRAGTVLTCRVAGEAAPRPPLRPAPLDVPDQVQGEGVDLLQLPVADTSRHGGEQAVVLSQRVRQHLVVQRVDELPLLQEERPTVALTARPVDQMVGPRPGRICLRGLPRTDSLRCMTVSMSIPPSMTFSSSFPPSSRSP